MKVASRKREKSQQKDSSIKRKRAKKDVNTMDRMVDLISQLPDHLIHHIISFLCTKDACRTSILSKKWRSAWDTFPILDFDQRYFKDQEKVTRGLYEEQNQDMVGKKFRDFVCHSLLRRRLQNLRIQKLRLFVTSLPNLESHIAIWMSAATCCNVGELDIQVRSSENYSCPKVIYTAKTITALKLQDCKLDKNCKFMLPLLQKLNLVGIRVVQKMFDNFISSCPLIVDLRLVYCHGFETVRLVDLVKLNRVEFHCCFDIKRLDVVAPNLQIFWYYGEISTQCDVDLSECRTLKRLSLGHSPMTSEWFEKHLSSFPSLEKLALRRLCMLKSIQIISEHLRSLSLRSCMNLAQAVIDAPKLTSFQYEGNKLPFASMDPSSLLEAKISLGPTSSLLPGDNCISCSDKLGEFLGKFNPSLGLKLVVRFSQNIIVCEEWREIKLPRLGRLQVEIIKPSMSLEDLLDCVLQSFHPERLSLVTSSADSILKVINTKLDKPNCCGFYGNKCWRHELDAFDLVSLENFDAGIERASVWFTWLKSTSETRPGASHFRLKWKRKLGRFYDKR